LTRTGFSGQTSHAIRTRADEKREKRKDHLGWHSTDYIPSATEKEKREKRKETTAARGPTLLSKYGAWGPPADGAAG